MRGAKLMVEIDVPTKVAEVVAQSIKPDLQNNPRSAVDIGATSKGLVVTAVASDIASLRASTNAVLQWIDGAMRVCALVRK